MSLQITNQADYALRAMLYLTRLGFGKRAPSNIIAEEMNMSRIFLSRINTQLVNARLISTWRGARGGVALSRPPSEISVYDVLTAVDGPIRLTGCIEDPDCCPFSGTCPLHKFWIRTQEVLINQLKSTSLQDLVADENTLSADFLDTLRNVPQQIN
jgi:Rrf2 family iron-sulfur cluster assembly transcriptional regulator